MKLNVGTIGHIDHGKTTLMQALVAVLGEEMASRCVVTDTKHPIMDSFDDICGASPYPGRPKNQKRKAAWKAKLKAAQLKAFSGDAKR
jgi:hypothetical protein